MGVHFSQKYVYDGTGEQAWFADLDPKCQLQDKTRFPDGSDEGNATPSYRALLASIIVKPVANKVRVLKYRLKRLKSHFFNPNSNKPAKPKDGRGIKWAETELEFQEQEARERHGAHEYTVYQITQARIRVQKLRRKYLQKRAMRYVPVAEHLF